MASTGTSQSGSTFDFAGPVKRITDASVGYVASLADAASKGLGKFSESVTESNLGRLDLSNGFLRGTVAVWSVALEEVPKAVSRFYDTLLERPAQTQRAKTAAKRTPKSKRR